MMTTMMKMNNISSHVAGLERFVRTFFFLCTVSYGILSFVVVMAEVYCLSLFRQELYMCKYHPSVPLLNSIIFI